MLNLSSVNDDKDIATKEYADAKALKTEAIKNITRSGTTFTATRCDNTTFTFTQQDNNSVTGVKGNSESSYRTGNVNLTAANVGAASATHAHGNITSGGDITATAPTIASGDCLVVNDDSESKITNGPTFGTSTTTYLRNDGSWATPASSVTGVKGNSETSYRTGQVNLTAANIGAAAASHTHAGGDITSAVANATNASNADKVNNLTVQTAVPANAVFTDTKNTAGSTADANKLFLVGAKNQAASDTTYSQANAYITAGKVYSNAKEVVNLSDSQALTNKTYNGYTLGAACAKGVGSVASGNTGLVTGGDVYNALGGYFDEALAAIGPSDIGAASASHTHAAGDVTSGTFAAARIPDLAASKITSGTLATARGGVPTGGTAGQVLTKASATDNDLAWTTPSSGGTGRQTTYYATSSTAAGTAAKVITVSGWTPATGDILGVRFQYANTAATPTLNVNSAGAKTIYVGNSAPNSTTNPLRWNAYDMVYFMFDGSAYRYITKAPLKTTLYNNATGTTDAVTLSVTAANFNFMRIYFKKTSGQNQCSSIDVFSPNQKYANLTVFEPATTAMWFASRTVYINGTSITTYNSVSGVVSGSPSAGTNAEVAIYRVEAW